MKYKKLVEWFAVDMQVRAGESLCLGSGKGRRAENFRDGDSEYRETEKEGWRKRRTQNCVV